MAFALSGVARSMLFGLDGTDPFALSLAVSVLAVVALTTGLVSARRAARVDPMVTLRHQ